MPRFELISFPLCPFVQRSLITLKYKKVEYSLKEIDLQDPPAWFEQLSPLGKVPVMVVDEKTVLFESAVINEYIDEITEPRLHPADPLRRAQERAWIEFGSELIGEIYGLSMESDRPAFEEMRNELFAMLERLEAALGEGPYFRGRDFSLVDTSFAPALMRLALLPAVVKDPRYARLTKVRRWSDSLLEIQAVRESVKPGFAEAFRSRLQSAGSLALDY